MAKANFVCMRCEDPVVAKRRDSPIRLAGFLLMLISLFVFWPMMIVGLLMLLFGGTRRLCPNCSSDQLVPLDSGAAKRIIEGKVSSTMAARMASQVVCERCGQFGYNVHACQHCGFAGVHLAGSPAANAILSRPQPPTH